MSESDAKSTPRSRGVLLAGVFAGAVVVALVVVLIATLGGSAPPDAPRGDGTGQQSPSPGDSPARANLNHQVPTEPPEGVHWELYQGFAVPYSRMAGPYRVNGAVATGYAHTPTGALIASQQISARALLSDGGSWKRVVRRQVVASEGRRKYVRNRLKVTSEVPPGTLGQVAGFRFVTYTDRTAVIQIATRFPPSGELQVTTMTMRWTDGTWKLVIQPSGGFSPTAQTIQDLSGFVPWGGV